MLSGVAKPRKVLIVPFMWVFFPSEDKDSADLFYKCPVPSSRFVETKMGVFGLCSDTLEEQRERT